MLNELKCDNRKTDRPKVSKVAVMWFEKILYEYTFNTPQKKVFIMTTNWIFDSTLHTIRRRAKYAHRPMQTHIYTYDASYYMENSTRDSVSLYYYGTMTVRNRDANTQ